MRRILSNTTALVACLSLSLPLPALAQQEDQAEETCAEPPCDDLIEAAPEADAEGAEVLAEEPSEVEEGMAPEEAVEVEEPVESEADIAVEVAPESQSQDPSDQADAEVEDGPAPEEAVKVEEPVESEADIAVEIAPESQSEDPSDEVAEDQDAVDATQGEAVETEASPAAAEAPAANTAQAEARASRKKSAKEKAAAEKAAADDAAKAASSATAAKAGADAKAKVTEERVTRENSRSSDENFGSRLTDAIGLDDEDTRNALIGTVLGTLGGYAASQMLGNRQVVASSQDRIVVQRADGEYQLLKDDNALLRQPGSQVRTETFDDGSTRTTVTREDGSQIVTIRDAELRVVRRTKLTTDGRELVLIDDTAGAQAIDVSALPAAAETQAALSDEEALRQALAAAQRPDRSYSLAQVREVQAVRAMAPAIQLDNVTFETGSAAITPDQAEELNELGQLIAGMIEENPREIFLVEGHTDATGNAAMNLALSDRRAESVALALTEYFGVPPENLVVQGYGERYLRVQTEEAERLNRRASVRRITELLQVASAN